MSDEWKLACFLSKVMLLQGTGTAADIDLGMILSDNHPIGPLKRADLIGQSITGLSCLGAAEFAHCACNPTIHSQQFATMLSVWIANPGHCAVRRSRHLPGHHEGHL